MPIIKKLAIAASFMLASLVCQANSWDLNLAAGAIFPHLTNKTTVTINSSGYNNYLADQEYKTQPIMGLGASRTFTNIGQKPVDFRLGLMAYYANFNHVQGTEYPLVNTGGTSSLSYQFNAKSMALFTEPHIIYTKYSWQPYLLAGAGASWNNLSSYNTTPNTPDATDNSSFTDRTTLSFAHEVGIGLQHELNVFNNSHKAHCYVSADYRYMDFGHGMLGPSPAQTSSDRLTVAHMRTQAVLLGLRASF